MGFANGDPTQPRGGTPGGAGEMSGTARARSGSSRSSTWRRVKVATTEQVQAAYDAIEAQLEDGYTGVMLMEWPDGDVHVTFVEFQRPPGSAQERARRPIRGCVVRRGLAQTALWVRRGYRRHRGAGRIRSRPQRRSGPIRRPAIGEVQHRATRPALIRVCHRGRATHSAGSGMRKTQSGTAVLAGLQQLLELAGSADVAEHGAVLQPLADLLLATLPNHELAGPAGPAGAAHRPAVVQFIRAGRERHNLRGGPAGSAGRGRPGRRRPAAVDGAGPARPRHVPSFRWAK